MKEKYNFIRVCKEIHNKGLVVATGGNISMRLGDRIYITPTGDVLGFTKWKDVVEMDLDGKIYRGGNPSKEFPFHLGIYNASPQTGAVVHIHSFYSVCVGALCKNSDSPAMPAYTTNYIKMVGHLPVVPFQKPGSQELSDSIVDALSMDGTNAVLMQNHGVVSAGRDILEAFYRAEIIEENAHFHMLLKEKGRALSEADINLIG